MRRAGRAGERRGTDPPAVRVLGTLDPPSEPGYGRGSRTLDRGGLSILRKVGQEDLDAVQPIVAVDHDRERLLLHQAVVVRGDRRSGTVLLERVALAVGPLTQARLTRFQRFAHVTLPVPPHRSLRSDVPRQVRACLSAIGSTEAEARPESLLAWMGERCAVRGRVRTPRVGDDRID